MRATATCRALSFRVSPTKTLTRPEATSWSGRGEYSFVRMAGLTILRVQAGELRPRVQEAAGQKE
jgi:hypothetical protein